MYLHEVVACIRNNSSCLIVIKLKDPREEQTLKTRCVLNWTIYETCHCALSGRSILLLHEMRRLDYTRLTHACEWSVMLFTAFFLCGYPTNRSNALFHSNTWWARLNGLRRLWASMCSYTWRKLAQQITWTWYDFEPRWRYVQHYTYFHNSILGRFWTINNIW